jgi:mRNA interferase YafQ
MYEIVYTRKFLKDFKRHSKTGLNFKGKLNEVIELLGSNIPLGVKHKDHKLNGEWEGYRECHVLFDLLLVYKYYEKHVELVTLDTHDALF